MLTNLIRSLKSARVSYKSLIVRERFMKTCLTFSQAVCLLMLYRWFWSQCDAKYARPMPRCRSVCLLVRSPMCQSIHPSNDPPNPWAFLLDNHLYINRAARMGSLYFISQYSHLLLQAVSVIGAHHVIRVAILRALRYSPGYSHKTWILRILRSSADAISVIRVGHYAVGVIPNIHSCANSVMNLAWALLQFQRAWRR